MSKEINATKKNIKELITRDDADSLLREFRSDCLPFGEYPDIILLDFLNKIYGDES